MTSPEKLERPPSAALDPIGLFRVCVSALPKFLSPHVASYVCKLTTEIILWTPLITLRRLHSAGVYLKDKFRQPPVKKVENKNTQPFQRLPSKKYQLDRFANPDTILIWVRLMHC